MKERARKLAEYLDSNAVFMLSSRDGCTLIQCPICFTLVQWPFELKQEIKY